MSVIGNICGGVALTLWLAGFIYFFIRVLYNAAEDLDMVGEEEVDAPILFLLIFCWCLIWPVWSMYFGYCRATKWLFRKRKK